MIRARTLSLILKQGLIAQWSGTGGVGTVSIRKGEAGVSCVPRGPEKCLLELFCRVIILASLLLLLQQFYRWEYWFGIEKGAGLCLWFERVV